MSQTIPERDFAAGVSASNFKIILGKPGSFMGPFRALESRGERQNPEVVWRGPRLIKIVMKAGDVDAEQVMTMQSKIKYVHIGIFNVICQRAAAHLTRPNLEPQPSNTPKCIPRSYPHMPPLKHPLRAILIDNYIQR